MIPGQQHKAVAGLAAAFVLNDTLRKILLIVLMSKYMSNVDVVFQMVGFKRYKQRLYVDKGPLRPGDTNYPCYMKSITCMYDF